MDTYCVIRFKDKPEKVKILTLLASETEAEYKVTIDLKEFVAEKFNVIITDKVEMRDQGTNTDSENITKLAGDQKTIVKVSPTNNISDVIAPTINTLPMEHSSAPIVPPSPIDINVVDQQVPVVEQQQRLTVTTIKDEPVNTTVDFASPTVDNHTFDNIITAQPFDSTVHPHNLTNMDDYGTYVPYREGMVEPKQERIEDELEVMDFYIECYVDEDFTQESIAMNEDAPSTSSRLRRITERSGNSMDDDRNNEEEYISEQSLARINAPSSSSRLGTTRKRMRDSMDDDNENAPSTSRRSGKTTKKSKYSMDEDDKDAPSTRRRSGRITEKPDYSVDSDNEPESVQETEKRKNNNKEKVTSDENIENKCQKCGTICAEYREKNDHVMMVHRNLIRYECLVDGCRFKTGYKCNVTRHFKSKHKEITRCFKEIALTREQTDEVNTAMKECFPGTANNRDSTCRFCGERFSGSCPNFSYNKRQHALQHVDFFSYKCMKEGCQFESKTKRLMNSHLTRCSYGEDAKGKFQTNKLTKKQELEIEEMLTKCFPKIDTNREEVDESDE